MLHPEHPLWRRLEYATAAGAALLIVFWLAYFLANDALRLVEPAYTAFEETFVVADTILAALLLTASHRLRHRRPAAPLLLAAAAAMTLYLGVLDATFYARNGVLLSLTGKAALEAGIVGVCVGGGGYGLWAARRLGGWPAQHAPVPDDAMLTPSSPVSLVDGPRTRHSPKGHHGGEQ